MTTIEDFVASNFSGDQLAALTAFFAAHPETGRLPSDNGFAEIVVLAGSINYEIYLGSVLLRAWGPGLERNPALGFTGLPGISADALNGLFLNPPSPGARFLQ